MLYKNAQIYLKNKKRIFTLMSSIDKKNKLILTDPTLASQLYPGTER